MQTDQLRSASGWHGQRDVSYWGGVSEPFTQCSPDWSTFKLLRGIHGEYIANGYGDYMISIRSEDRKRVLTSSRITLSPEHPCVESSFRTIQRWPQSPRSAWPCD